jgi:cytochrome c biogenesis protein CcmG/thiol:disulfide interchange protein DsbE
MFRLAAGCLGFIMLLSACSGPSVDISEVPDLPVVAPDEVTALLAASDQPVVLNVWASWCTPCRSEAPLLSRAAAEFEGSVDFVGVNVRDGMDDARGFIAEFFPDTPISHLHDRPGDVPVALGGTNGVPLTFFYAAGGELVYLHPGVIDERTLALQIDEILARSS